LTFRIEEAIYSLEIHVQKQKQLRMKYIIYLSLGLFFLACQPAEKTVEDTIAPKAKKVAVKEPINNKLDKYWYQGKAEISRYELQQNRYADVHPGEAIMIFVTEDFLTDKQVKNDRYQNPNSVSVLKNNRVRKFPTGIYDYSMMTSVFTPVNSQEYTGTLKITNSSQEWCGHTFMQLNRKDEKFDITLRSYFESEGDTKQEVELAVLEDDLFNRIRINPNDLPKGQIKMYPSMNIARLRHLPYQALDAKVSLEDYQGNEFDGESLKVYRVEFPSLSRTLEIVFNATAPYVIEGWKDAYPSAFDRRPRTTIAKRTHTILEPYWQQNALEDMSKRAALGTD
jgi:hypothetical protein